MTIGDNRKVNVLELGSGTGILGIGIASLGCKVVLTDPGLDMNLSEEKCSNTIEHLMGNLEKNKHIIEDRFVDQTLRTSS